MAWRNGMVALAMATFGLGCPTSSPGRVEIRPALAASTHVPLVAPSPEPVAAGAVPVRSRADASWARTFPKAKTFREIVAPPATEPSSPSTCS